MAKIIQYPKGAVIFYEGRASDAIYLLREGRVVLSRLTPETSNIVSVEINKGEFFGVKDVLANSLHVNQATAISDATVVLLSLEEFEQSIIKDNNLASKMLKAFSMQLKLVHQRLSERFGVNDIIKYDLGLFNVASGFFNAKEFQPCIDVCERFLRLYQESEYREKVKKLLQDAWAVVADTPIIQTPSIDGALKDFDIIEAFKRFEKTIPPQQIIFSEFEEGDSFYMVCSGVVRESKCIRDDNKTISFVAPGGFFGVNGFFDEKIRDVTCMSTDVVEVLEFSYENLKAIISANPKFAFMLLKMLAKRINESERMIKNLCIIDTSLRIKDMLIMLDENGYSKKLDGAARKIYLTAHDISVWINIPEEEAEIEVKDLAKHGIIQIYDNYLIVNNLEEIKRLHFVKNK